MLRKIVLASVSAVALMTGATEAPAQTRLADADSGSAADKKENEGIADIVVTATRQTTNLQSTPIAITAVTADALEDRGLKSVSDLSAVVPNAQFRRAQGAFGPGVTTFIRGLGTSDTSLGGEAAVAFYIDDVYYPILLGSNFDLLDIDHVEVLRGPQGTLFGRNSLAGAVNIVSKEPSTKETSGYAEFTTGRYNRRDFRAGINMPIADNAAFTLSGVSKKRTGYQKMLDFTCEMVRRGTPQLAGKFPVYQQQLTATPNYTPNDCTVGHFGGEDTRAARASFLWRPMPSLKLIVTADKTWDDSENPADTTIDINPANVPPNLKAQADYYGLVYDNRFVTGSPFSTYATYVDRVAAGTVLPAGANTFYNGMTDRGGLIMSPFTHLKNWGVAGKAYWDLTEKIKLTAVIGYREMDENHSFDNDGGPLVIEHVLSNIGEKYTNAEVRLSGNEKWIDWVVGAFYFDGFGYFHATNYSPTGSFSVKTLVTTFAPNSKAGFANATIRPFGDRLGIVLGVRYSKDHKFVDYTNLTDVPPHPNGADTIFQVDPKQKKFSWKAGANYQLADTALVYASVATGNSLPGYNARPLQPTQVFQFDGNDDRAYELGAKVDLFDRHVRLNAAVFYTDFNNRPTSIAGGSEAALDPNTGKPVVGNQQLIPLVGGPDGSTACSTTLLPSNTGIVCVGRAYYVNQPATVRGFELEYTVNPIRNLSINGSVGWSKFKSPDIAARTVNRRQGYPYWTANAGVQYQIETPFIGGTVTPRLDWTFQSSEVISGTSTKYNYLTRARSLFNTRLTYNNTDHDFSVALGATNLFNKTYYINYFDYQTLGRANTQGQPGKPREWYLTVSKKF
jgi:iron complex outermembrane receptor protein